MNPEYSISDFFDKSSIYFNGAISFGALPASAQLIGLDGISPATISAGELQGNTIVADGYLQSSNYVAATTGWQLTPTSGELNFAVSLGVGSDIGGFEVGADYLRDAANSFGLASTVSGGDDVRVWMGAAFADRATAPLRMTEAGAVTGSSITITGGAISGTPLSAIPNSTATDISLLECSHDLVFSVTDADTIAWATGTIVFSNGRTFSISAGNTGNMAALTYIYLDPAVSSTVLQTTTTYSTAMGANKRLIGTAQNHTVTASFIPYGAGVPLIDGANIGALSIVAGNIAASTITSGKLSVSQLSAIAADLGAITAGTVTINTAGYVRGGQTDFNTGTGFFLGYSGAAYKFSVGTSTDYFSFDGTQTIYTGVVSSLGLFGDGSDGDVTISTNTTLSADKKYRNLTINTGVTLTTAGYSVHVLGTLTTVGTGAIVNNGGVGGNGGDASGTTAGAGGTAGTATGGATFAAGTAGAAGAAGLEGGLGDTPGNPGTNGVAANPALGGSGGAGGVGGTTPGGDMGQAAGGTAGTATSETVTVKSFAYGTSSNLSGTETTSNKRFAGVGSSSGVSLSSGAGGGGGGSGAVDSHVPPRHASGGGGGGGASGGIIFIAAKIITNNGTISANAGNGGNAGTRSGEDAGGSGGGGGGGGGAVILVYETLINNGSITATKGTGGAKTDGSGGTSNGVVGNDGVDGTVYKLKIV